MDPTRHTLADRLGTTRHESPLRWRLKRLMDAFPSPGAAALEDWLLDVANVRGADFVTRQPPRDPAFQAPPRDLLSNEDLVAAICQVNNEDRPQMIRSAAQLISSGAVDPALLLFAARRERAERVLAELARQAVKVDPEHPVWKVVFASLSRTPPTRSPIVHWTRLAVPVPDERGCNAKSWRLIA